MELEFWLKWWLLSGFSRGPGSALKVFTAQQANMTAQIQLPVTLLVGSPGTGRRTLVAALCQQSEPAAVLLQEAQGLADALWPIRTKYYSASTLLSLHALNISPPPDTEAVLLVISCALGEDSLAAVQQWAGQHDIEDAGVRLMVATHADLLPMLASEPGHADVQPSADNSSLAAGMQRSRPAWLEAAMQWCSEHCWEYIEVCCSDPGERGFVPTPITASVSFYQGAATLKSLTLAFS